MKDIQNPGRSFSGLKGVNRTVSLHTRRLHRDDPERCTNVPVQPCAKSIASVPADDGLDTGQ